MERGKNGKHAENLRLCLILALRRKTRYLEKHLAISINRKCETVNEILDYLRNRSLTDDDIRKLLKNYPQVLGCGMEHELKNNVQILEKDWEIEGKTLRNLLLRNPKVLGYNVDCKGDCMAQCTRCWVRF
ncbi:hypothetical protein Pint_07733 [Pistacia integerrima]|uniref:Uncharacterized protein n=1 Tax=Pistacia integerrima TaxID=434235 RepID=A0ACC0XXN6_9ROSI|nr:hypothetical protein Pint_07733 [Pistacia integerrima]